MPCLREPKDPVGGKDQGRVGAARDEKPNLASCGVKGWKQREGKEGTRELKSQQPKASHRFHQGTGGAGAARGGPGTAKLPSQK